MSQVIDWINDTIINEREHRIDSSDIDDIRDFSLLWNLFEDICWNQNNENSNAFPLREILKIVSSKYQSLRSNQSDIDEIYNYFIDRYQDNNKFDNLKFRDNETENIAKTLLEKAINDSSSSITFEEKIKIILSIIHRYRNNLFHGEKDMQYIRLQKGNFEKSNKFLMLFIEKCKPS